MLGNHEHTAHLPSILLPLFSLPVTMLYLLTVQSQHDVKAKWIQMTPTSTGTCRTLFWLHALRKQHLITSVKLRSGAVKQVSDHLKILKGIGFTNSPFYLNHSGKHCGWHSWWSRVKSSQTSATVYRVIRGHSLLPTSQQPSTCTVCVWFHLWWNGYRFYFISLL